MQASTTLAKASLDRSRAQGAYAKAQSVLVYVLGMGTVIDLFLAERDNGQNADILVFFHTYDYPTPRNAPAFARAGPWLYKTLHDIYAIPPEDWIDLTDGLFQRMATMMYTIAANRAGMNLHVVDTAGTIVRANINIAGVSNDWENESLRVMVARCTHCGARTQISFG